MRSLPHTIFRLLVLAALLGPVNAQSTARATTDIGRPDQAVLLPGMQPASTNADVYLSAPTTARPFTHMLVRREAFVPRGASLTLAVRASVDGSRWSDWRELRDNDDLWLPEDGLDVVWSQILDVGATASYWQIRGTWTPAPDGIQPDLRRIEVNTVNVPGSGSALLPPAIPAAVSIVSGKPAKPPVVSRTSWGAGDGQTSRVVPSYYPVSHLVLHHTADSDSLYPSEQNWAARVRAIWSFHTFTRGWGDIGYNYLIDPNGVIYEGRAGGDNAVGFHDTANYGSMGVAVIGTYDQYPMPPAAQDALVRLLSWKAGERDIDPFGSSYYYGCTRSTACQPFHPDAIVQTITGHKQVTPGRTVDPSELTMALLPELRSRVRQAILAGDTTLIVDDRSPGFTRSEANWHIAACGYGGSTLWTYATDTAAQSTNSARWQATLSRSGVYRVYVAIPQGCALAAPPYATTTAKYLIRHAGGTTMVAVNQNTAAAWVELGSYMFDAATDGIVELTDNTGEPFSQRRVLFFDALKWVWEGDRDSSLPNMYALPLVIGGEARP
jgi:hypothetical protein